jgi:hypothetical protein
MKRIGGPYTLKGHREHRTHDGFAMIGDLVEDGNTVAHYQHDGTGGEMWFDWYKDDVAEARANTWARENLPAAFGGHVPDAETLVESLADEAANLKRFRRVCKAKTLFRLPTDPLDEYRQIAEPLTPRVRDYITRKHPTAEILNDQIA